MIGEFNIPDYGITDVIGIKGDFVDQLKSRGIIPKGGDESDLIIWQELRSKPIEDALLDKTTETIVCEIKGSSHWQDAFLQLFFRKRNTQKPGYLKNKCFNKGYACFGSLDPNIEDKRKYKWENGNKKWYKAGSLILNNHRVQAFQEDDIDSSERERQAPSVLLQEPEQKKLIQSANKEITRKIISNIEIIKLCENINTMKVNEVFAKIKNMTFEEVLSKID